MFPILRLKVRKKLAFSFLRGLTGQTKMRILNVAEKNDAAKNIALLLSGGTATKRDGFSVYNKIYEFECEVFGQNSRMIMTSVTGHLLDMAFDPRYTCWKTTDPISLFEAPLVTVTKSENENIKRTLEAEIKTCSKLIIWTDCDREGENIGFEIISVCKLIKKNLAVYRARFSEINLESVKRALRNLVAPDERVSNAVEVRKELDLRIGFAFTRFQTLFLNRTFPNALNQVVSYGSCQFPTLGFVVERFKAISDFTSEKFWLINVQHTLNELSVDFHWKRNRLFDKLACEVLYEKCAECETARVENVESRPQTKWRPKPLDTVTLEKLALTKFRISAKEVMRIAENLYAKGFISYPRTETNFFSKEINLVQLVEYQTEDAQWGEFAQRVLRDGPNPFQGKKSDDAHSPIHPIKYTNTLSGNEKRVYEFIVRHFLACLSKHAEGLQTTVDIDVAGEKFSAKGLMVTAKNYLEVYPYEKWSDKEIHIYRKGEIFKPELSMNEGETSPPNLLTEADLIGLMEKHGIGTDSTHAEHIETIKARLYVGLQDGKYFVPRTLGMGLIEGYNNMGHGMAKPELRAELEADLKRICNGEKSPAEVLTRHINKYKAVYEDVQKKLNHLSEAIQNYVEIEPTPVEPGFLSENVLEAMGKCPTCHSDLLLKTRKNKEKFIGCSAFPQCRTVVWLPSFVLDVTATENFCPTCGPNTRLLRFKFEKGSCYYPCDHVGCIGGCDPDLLELLNFKADGRKPNSSAVETRSILHENNDSGFVSLQSTSSSELPLADSPPKCHCGMPATCFTVKKLGPDTGKEFYKCGVVGQSSKCDFFQWKNKRNWNKSKNVKVDDGDVRCYCSIPCRRVTATKEGPNKGRPFYTCGKSLHDSHKCNFFEWADDRENLNFEVIARKTGGRGETRSDTRNRKDRGWTLTHLRQKLILINRTPYINGQLFISDLFAAVSSHICSDSNEKLFHLSFTGLGRRVGFNAVEKEIPRPAAKK